MVALEVGKTAEKTSPNSDVAGLPQRYGKIETRPIMAVPIELGGPL
jgi:hypothetical protein